MEFPTCTFCLTLSVTVACAEVVSAEVAPPGPRAATAVAELAENLANGDLQGIQNSTTQILRLQAGRFVVPVLIEALRSSDPEIRHAAVTAVETVGADAGGACHELVRLLSDADVNVRRASRNALASIGDSVVPVLAGALASENETTRRGAADVLYRFGPRASAAVPALSKTIKDSDDATRIFSVYAVGAIGREARELIPTVTRLLADRNPAVRRAAAEALGWMGPASEAAVGRLRDLLLEDLECSYEAAIALSSIGGTAVNVLIEALRHPNETVRHYAVIALIRAGPSAKPAVPVLKASLRDSSWAVRIEAAVALWAIDNRLDGISTLSQALRNPRSEVRRNACLALARIGPEARETVSALVKVVSKPSGAYGPLLFLRGKNWRNRVLKLVLEIVRHGADADPAYAAIALGNIGPDAHVAVPDLLKATMTGQGGRWLNISDALGLIGKPAVPALTENLQAKDHRVRLTAAAALGDIGPEARSAVPAMFQLLEDEHNQVRKQAKESLKAILLPATAAKSLPSFIESIEKDNVLREFIAKSEQIPSDDVTRVIISKIPQRLSQLRRQLQHSDSQKRAQAAEELGSMGVFAKSAIDDLLPLLDDEDVFARINVAAAVWQIAGRMNSPHTILVSALGNRTALVRKHACRAIGRIGPNAKPLDQNLTELLEDDEPTIRFAAAEALWKLRARQNDVIVTLISMLDDGESLNVQTDAAEVLARIGPPAKAAIPALERARAVHQLTAATKALQRIKRPAPSETKAPP